MDKGILSSDPQVWQTACIIERSRKEDWCRRGAVFALGGAEWEGKVPQIKVRSAGCWKSGIKGQMGQTKLKMNPTEP